MVQKGFVVDFRQTVRPLALLAASAVLLSTSPLHAQSPTVGGVVPRFAFSAEEGGDDDSTSSDVERWTALARTGSASSAAVVGTAVASHAVVQVAASSAAPATAAHPSPPRDDGSTLRTVGYFAGGVGIVGVVLFAVAGIGAKRAHDRLDEDCNSGRCQDAAQQSNIEDGKLLQTAANIGLAAGLTGIGLGVTLIVLGAHSASDTMQAGGMSATGGTITYGGRF